MTNWKGRREAAAKKLAKSRLTTSYLRANCESVAKVVRGLGPDDTEPKAGAGARVVFNMPCAHIPAFCRAAASNASKPYQNAYDRNKASDDRKRVDKAIHEAVKLKPEEIYFGAVETSGSGIRFYGDMCLVLAFQPPISGGSGRLRPRSKATEADVIILDRNSYDVIREPAASAIAKRRKRNKGLTFEAAAARELQERAGSWSCDLAEMVSLKLLGQLPIGQRRWTTGQIADAVLQDEDYLEVLYPKSFGTTDLLEVRISASDAAAEGDIADRELAGECPALHELEWRQQRREARRALARSGVQVRVVSTTGRTKSS